MNALKKLHIFLIPLTATLVLQGLMSLVILRDMPFVSDAQAYHVQAIELLRGGYGDRPFYYPPGTTIMLAGAYSVFGVSALVSKLVVLAANAVTAVCVVSLALLLTRRRRIALLAGILFAIYPPVFLLASQPYSQHFAQLWLIASVLCWLQALERRSVSLFALCGLCVGFGALTRPSMLSIGLVMAVTGVVVFRCAWHRRIDLLKLGIGAAVCLSVLAAAVAPVVVHNAERKAGVTISTNNERNFFIGNNPRTPWYKTAHLAQRPFSELPSGTRTFLQHYNELPEAEARAAMREAALDFIRARPLYFVLQSLNRLRAFWGFDYLASRRIQLWQDWGPVPLFALVMLEAGGYGIVMILTLLGIFSVREYSTGAKTASLSEATLEVQADNLSPQFIKWTIIAFVLAYQLPYGIAFSGGTYHFPVMALLLPFAAVGLLRSWSDVRDHATSVRHQPVRVWIAIALFLLIQLEYAYFTWRYF